MPSRYLQEIPAELIDWRQSPGMASRRRHAAARAQRPRRRRLGEVACGTARGSPDPPRRATEDRVGEPGHRQVRDNGDLTLEAGDRIRHTDFGEGRVIAVTGEGTKRDRGGAVRHRRPQEAADQDRAH